MSLVYCNAKKHSRTAKIDLNLPIRFENLVYLPLHCHNSSFNSIRISKGVHIVCRDTIEIQHLRIFVETWEVDAFRKNLKVSAVFRLFESHLRNLRDTLNIFKRSF